MKRVLDGEHRTQNSELTRALARHDRGRGASLESARDVIVTVMRLALDGEEKIARLERPAVDRHAADHGARAAGSARRRALR